MNRPTMTRMIFALSLGFVGVILATQIAFANPQCGNREALADELPAKGERI
jgi:hypothetical protein